MFYFDLRRNGFGELIEDFSGGKGIQTTNTNDEFLWLRSLHFLE